MEFTTYTLPNGIRGIHRRIKGNVTHCALLVNAGSRDELKHQFGLAHFTEHALFKGTEHRKAYQVNCRLENLGGELNAFTTKEDTTIHATTLRSDFSKAVELIADVAFQSRQVVAIAAGTAAAPSSSSSSARCLPAKSRASSLMGGAP